MRKQRVHCVIERLKSVISKRDHYQRIMNLLCAFTQLTFQQKRDCIISGLIDLRPESETVFCLYGRWTPNMSTVDDYTNFLEYQIK